VYTENPIPVLIGEAVRETSCARGLPPSRSLKLS
jgi:hypothetical protein